MRNIAHEVRRSAHNGKLSPRFTVIGHQSPVNPSDPFGSTRLEQHPGVRPAPGALGLDPVTIGTVRTIIAVAVAN